MGAGTVLALDGREMTRATIVPNSLNYDVIVLHSIEAQVTQFPWPGTNYVAGDALGTAHVVYKGPAAGFREHVIPANATNHYRIYSIQPGDYPYPYYSDGLIPGSPLITMPYPSNVYSETFSYTNIDLSVGSFSNKLGGHHWTNAWSLSLTGTGHGWQVQTNGVAGLPMFKVTESNYPTVVGNRAVLTGGDAVGAGFARRGVYTNEGNIFVGCVVAYKYPGDTKYMTIGLMNGDTTEMEFGKVYGYTNLFSIRRQDANALSTYAMNGWESDTNNWYWMVVKYNFESNTAWANCYYKGEGIPYLEPSTWDVEWSSMDIPQITAIELKGGSGGSGWVGGAVWDEIRVSSIWPELIGQPGLVPWPSRVDFGEVESTLSSNLTLYIANSGGDNVPLYVTNDPSFVLTGPDKDFFEISTNRFDDILFYTQSNHFSVTFWPTNSGTNLYTNAWLMVSNNSGVNPYPIQLLGTGIPTVSTNVPMVSNYWVGFNRWVNDAMVTSGVFDVSAQVYHVRGIYMDGAYRPGYDLVNGEGVVILTNEPFGSWSTEDGTTYLLSDAVHPGAWPATPSTNYLLRVRLVASNLIAHTNTLYTADGVVTANDLFFTEYVEGSGTYDKAIEIYNGTGAAIDLSQYGIRHKMNNTSAEGDYYQLPSQMLGHGDVFVIAHTQASAEILAVADYTSDEICIFNGDDSIFLHKGIGLEGLIPTDAIFADPSGGNFYQDTTYRRLSSVTNSASTYNAAEWAVYAEGTISGLGAHEMDGALGKPMRFHVTDDDVEGPEIANALVGTNEPTSGSPGPDIYLADLPTSGLPISWSIHDYDSGIVAASNRYILKTGSTVVASGYLPAGTNENGGALSEPLALSVDVPLASLPGGSYSLALVGSDNDPEYVGDTMVASNQYYFRLLSPYIAFAPAVLDFGQVGVGLTSNMTVSITNFGNQTLWISDIEFVGTGYALFEADTDEAWIAPGESLNVTVYFTPAGGGYFDWQMVIHNDSGNDPDAVVQLLGNCYDPETSPPEIIDYSIVDADTNTAENVVTDHAAAHGELAASFTIYQYTGMRLDGASFDLVYPDGTLAVENVPLAMTGTTTNEGNLCFVFEGVPPPFYPATLGVYTARVSSISSNGIQMVDEVNFRTLGGGVQELTETFSNVVNNSGSYLSGTATNGDWGDWTYKGTRWDVPLSGKAPTIGPLGQLVSPTLSNGCTQISFDYKRPFSESGALNLDVIVNGDVVGTVTALPPDTVTIYTHVISGLSYSNEVVVTFTNRATSNKRTTVDNIKLLTLGSATNALLNFTVVDEDDDGPDHDGFNVDGANFSTNQFLPGGLVVTGLVGDLQSGVYAASNTWALLSELGGVPITNGTMTMTPDVNGEGISNGFAALTATIPGNLLNFVDEQFIFQVVSTDYDADRPGDWTQTTSHYTFGIAAYVPTPTNFVAVADGPETVRMSWSLNGADNVALLWSTNGPVANNSIAKGTTLAVNDVYGNAKVAYLGNTTISNTLIVPTGSSNHFRLFGRAGTTYSASYVEPVSTNPVQTFTYERGEICDQFAYTNSTYPEGVTNAVTLQDQEGLATGQGWSGAWFGDLDKYTIDDTNLVHGTSGYPTPHANKLQWVYNSTAVGSAHVYRKLAVPRLGGGRTFIAFMMNYKTPDTHGTDKYVGISLMSTATNDCDREELFFGKPTAAGDAAGIYSPDTLETTASTTNLIASHFQDNMFVAEWNGTEHTARLWVFNAGQTIPENYLDATPVATYSNDAITMATITGLRCGAGKLAEGGVSLDHVYFDEIRVGGTWDEVLNFTYPKVYDYALDNGTNWITDGQLAQPDTNYPVSFTVYHRTTIKEAEFNLLDLENPEEYLYDPTNQTVLYGYNEGVRQVFTNLVVDRLPTQEVALAVYTSRVWVTSTSDKTTNTISLSEQGGADNLFFGEFGEGNNYDKYVEIYNGTGSAIDLSQYAMARQNYDPQKYVTWSNWCMLSPETYWLEHGATVAILNGGLTGGVAGIDTVSQELVDAMDVAGRPYLFSTNNVLQVSGDDPVGLFQMPNQTEWLDVCGIGPATARYIMQRMEDAEVPWYYPEHVNTNQWDFREWEGDADDGYTNITATAGAYDRVVGLGGYIVFHVRDDDTDPPVSGTNTSVKVGTNEPYENLALTNGLREVILTAWSFTNNSIEAAKRPWWGSLLTNAYITWTPCYSNPTTLSNEMVVVNTGGTTVNEEFGAFNQITAGELYMGSIGSHGYSVSNVPWIQFELELVSAEDIAFSWAEKGGAYSFTNVSIQWSLTGLDDSFQTNAAWPPYTLTTVSDWRLNMIDLSEVVPKGTARIFLRFVLGPGYVQSSGAFRMDNIQLIGVPDELQITDGQIAQSGYQIQVQGNVYDPGSGIQEDQAVMQMGSVQGAVDGTKAYLPDGGKTNTSTLWWNIGSSTGQFSRQDITDLVLESQEGAGVALTIDVPDADLDRANDLLWFNGSLGRMRVLDDDTAWPKLTLASMQPRSSILAQWLFLSNTNSTHVTRSDSSVAVDLLKTGTINGSDKVPGTFVVGPTGGTYAVGAWGWQWNTKYWCADMVPEAEMAITSITFQSRFNITNSPTHFWIRQFVDNVEVRSMGPYVFAGGSNTNTPIASTNWGVYDFFQSYPTNVFVLPAGQTTQFRLHGMYPHTNGSFGSRWFVHNLTFRQVAMETNGVTEVSDAEFASGSYQLQGSTWDPASGICSTNSADESKRPRFSLNAPDGGVLVTNQAFNFSSNFVDGQIMDEAGGGFTADLPQPTYTNLMLGEYVGAASVWDYDDDRTYDTLQMRGDLSMYVVDNDNGAPSTVGVVRVNGQPMGTITRETAPWTNRPEFIVSFDTVAVDTDPGTNYTAKQRMLTGVGEYRVTTNDIAALAPSNRAGYGTPYPVAATNGALANYGFEMPNVGWTLTGDSIYHRYGYLADMVRPYEGTNCLKTANDGSASQTIEFVNLASNPPVVGVSGRYRCNSALGAVFRIEAFASSNLVTPVATSNLALIATDTNWASFSIDPATAAPIGDGTVELLKISLIDGGGNTTYWDDVRLSVGIGTNLPSMRFVATAANQGISNPNYLFAVDADNNRAEDRLGGPPVSFVTAYDVTPPTQVGIDHTTGATTEDVDDPTTQFDVQWSTLNVGPDNPAHTNYPSWGANNRDLLSPWKSYKIYYGTFNSLDVPLNDNPSTETGFIYTNFIANSNYLAWSNKTWDTAIEDPSATGTTNYLALTNLTQNKIRIFDLDFDQDYAVVVVGVDRAGNEGPATLTSWATNNTIKFSLTRGWTIPKNQIPPEFQSLPSLSNTNAPAAAGLAWIASGLINSNAGTQVTNLYTEVRKEYDLIYWDAPTFEERTNNPWALVATVQTNWLVDDGAQQRPPRGNMRFYRASYKDRWKTTRWVTISNEQVEVPQRPLASEEIYAVNNVILSEGQNFAALHGVPYTNTFEGVFGGTECFPGGASALSGTKVEFFTAGTNAPVGEVFYLTESGRWIRTNDNQDVTSTPMSNDFFSRGFSITLPTPLPSSYVTTNAWSDFLTKTSPIPAMIWSPIAQVPTNNIGFSQVIHCGQRRPPVLVYNVVALRLPVAAHPSQMNLIESGFTPGDLGASDEIYTLDTTTKEVLGGSTIYCDAGGTWRKVSGGTAPLFKPNDVIVIVSKNGGVGSTWTWNYHPAQFYTLPTRWMGWVTTPPVSLAPEPTTQASAVVFTNVSATQMAIGWTSGNGSNRIVVVRAGAATTWTPTDGIAPLGVNSDFMTAADQGGGNKVCYDGAGSSFTLMGLNPNTTYYVTIFEYNGAAASANFFLGGAPATGSQDTL
ncbi:MAG: lamin tail domain-containing protein [Kiritimatiellia bacterium]